VENYDTLVDVALVTQRSRGSHVLLEVHEVASEVVDDLHNQVNAIASQACGFAVLNAGLRVAREQVVNELVRKACYLHELGTLRISPLLFGSGLWSVVGLDVRGESINDRRAHVLCELLDDA